MRKRLAAALISAALFGSIGQVHASSNFFADVPAESWSYTAVNELIATGKVPGYPSKIPDGRIMSRLEVAMIIEDAQQNIGALTADEKSTLEKLRAEYLYDIKKLELIGKLDRLDEKLSKAITRVSVVRFDAFEDIGSDLSFCVAMLDAENNGIVISGIIGRDEARTYVKPIVEGESTYKLTREEEQALHDAMKK